MPIHHKFPISLITVIACAALTLTGCTTASQQGNGTPSGMASFDPATVAKDDTLANAVPASIRSKGVLTFGSDTSYAPAEFLGGPDGQTPQGYDVDLAKAIGSTLGLNVKVQTAEFTSILPALGPKYDLGISSFGITPERLEAVNFVSYFNAGTLWAVQKGNPKKFSLDDVCGKSVGVQTGTTQENPDISGRSKKCTDAGKPPINVVTLKTQTDITTRLMNGGIDAMSADSPIIRYALSQTGDRLETVGNEYDDARQGIAVAKNDLALADLISQAMNKLIGDGTYKKILDTWNNSEGAITKAEVNPAAAH
ncbi:ABC transporter substrate-binding protein [Arthrobacter sp. NPDC058127]|uniref:ABC transporter substrate-binding protein n=1 Tax=Arthrobacter sp. NPDC058127 TaxID=3346351 RepID=UPI0036F00FC7